MPEFAPDRRSERCRPETVRAAVWSCLATRPVPGKEEISQFGKVRPQRRTVPLDDRTETVVLDPLESRPRIDFGRKVGREETIALEPSRRHQDEDPKCRIR